MEVRFEMDDFISFFFYHRISNNFPPKNCFTEMVNVFSSKINFMEIVFEFNYLQFYAFPYRGRVWSMASDVYMHCFYSVENCIKMLKCAREKKNEGKITGREITRHQPEARNGQRLFILRYVVYAFAISIRHACELCIKHGHWAWWRSNSKLHVNLKFKTNFRNGLVYSQRAPFNGNSPWNNLSWANYSVYKYLYRIVWIV